MPTIGGVRDRVNSETDRVLADIDRELDAAAWDFLRYTFASCAERSDGVVEDQ